MTGWQTLLYKEVLRFWKVAFQTIAGPVLTAMIYLLIFGHALESHVKVYGEVSYTAFLVPGLAMTLGELPVADLPDSIQTDVGHVGNLLNDLRQLGQPGEVAPRDAEHLALFELAQTCQRGAEVACGQQRLEPPAHLSAQTLFAPRKLERFRL